MPRRPIASRRFSLPSMVVAIAVMVAGAWGCQSDELSESEAEVVRDIFRSGLEMEPDPYVRAETLRALEMTGDPRLGGHAEPLSRDSSPMVRVAAIRTMLAAEAPDADNRAVHVFTRGDEQEQFHLLGVIFDVGSPELRESIVENAHNTNSTRIRRRALQEGLIRDIDEADEEELDDLYSELGRYVLDDDPEIAGLALRILAERGQPGRADRFLERLGDQSRPLEERIRAAKVLALARVDAARDPFGDILSRAGADSPDNLGIAEESVDEELLRWTILGMAALGDEEFVAPAQRYLRDADPQLILDVLNALSTNPSPDATLSLRNRLRDRPPVGHQALKLYGPRDDARITSLIQATSHRHYPTRRLAASLLVEHFPDAWVNHLEEQLGYSDPSGVERNLRNLQTLLDDEERMAVVEGLQEPLEELATGDGQQFLRDDVDEERLQNTTDAISAMAADLLFRLTGDTEYAEIIAEHSDLQTHYAHLEFLATDEPSEYTDELRDYLHHDFYALRLMAAAGLWTALGDDVDLELLGWIPEE